MCFFLDRFSYLLARSAAWFKNFRNSQAQAKQPGQNKHKYIIDHGDANDLIEVYQAALVVYYGGAAGIQRNQEDFEPAFQP